MPLPLPEKLQKEIKDGTYAESRGSEAPVTTIAAE